MFSWDLFPIFAAQFYSSSTEDLLIQLLFAKAMYAEIPAIHVDSTTHSKVTSNLKHLTALQALTQHS